ncbi:MAG: aromatic ring-hydroxylating dioxygenase subunit alpha [Gemmatimonadales bacterium]|nr:MAG: aromatic ring-hydroxylating dioxygenase subunit alpha [Gemmatimonadales bacterium]
MTDPIEIDPDIHRSHTLPGWAYGDPALHERQKERVFARSWQLVAPADSVRAPGHVQPLTLMEGCLDEPLVLTRTDDGALHCLSNVCTHRGALVVEGEGHVRFLRCRYHGRKFGLNGCFQSMPEFDGVEGFPTEDDDLPALPLERWGPFLFTGLDPAQPFADWIGPVQERVGWMPLDQFRYDPTHSRDYLIDANWALYCDNYLEEFHIPFVHGASLTGALDYDTYRTERFAWGNLQFGMGSKGEPGFDLPAGHPDEGEPVVAFYFWLFPNLMLNFYPWGLSVNVVRPLGAKRTRVSFHSWVWKEELRGEGAGADLHRVEMEDEEVVESVQRGVRSRLYRKGRFSPRREVGTHHFHELLARMLS